MRSTSHHAQLRTKSIHSRADIFQCPGRACVQESGQGQASCRGCTANLVVDVGKKKIIRENEN